MKEYTVKVFEDGRKDWYLNGQRHREDGPAIEYVDGGKEWFLNGQAHREDGPAVECPDGIKQWYLRGELHREDGPAIERADGTQEWWLNDKEVTEAEHKRRTTGITMDDALAAGDGVILREQAERIAELEERISWLETTLDTVDAALSKWRESD